MSKIAYVNGKYLNFNNALISINDRSIHFSDAVYEVVAVYNSKLVFWKEHYDRLKKSLKLIGVDNFKNLELIYFKCNEIIRVNNLFVEVISNEIMTLFQCITKCNRICISMTFYRNTIQSD